MNTSIDLRSKLPNTGTSIFAVMSHLAASHKAINLAQGYPDFPTSPKLIELVSKAMKAGHNQYAPMPGIYSLREVISEKIEQLYGHSYDPEKEITVTAGATQAIYTIVSAFIHPGDEVIIFGPAYDCYDPSVRLNGGLPVEVKLKAPHYRIDWEQVRQKINPRTRMIILNTPHNPTGTLVTEEDMRTLEQIVTENGLILLSDEVYEHLVFDGLSHQGAARYPGLAQNSFIVASFGKIFHNTGWKMGYCAAPEPLMSEFRKVHQFNVFSVNHPVQKALAIFLSDASNYDYLQGFFEEKRNMFLRSLKGSRFEMIPSQGTYFQLLDYSKISDEKDTEIAKRWTVENGISSIPVSVFYQDGTDDKVLRFCFAKSEETLKKGAEILQKL